ncbi:MAG TPA: YARHG domain-containing protein [Ignavibacteria bacterium]
MKNYLIFFLFSIIFISCSKSNTSKDNTSNDVEKFEEKLKEKEKLLEQEKIKYRTNLINKNDSLLDTTKVYGIYPEGSTRYLKHQDFKNKSDRELKIMRYEIFARHGYIFQSLEWKKYFNDQPWYKPRYYDITKMLTDIEEANVKLIMSLGYGSQGSE